MTSTKKCYGDVEELFAMLFADSKRRIQIMLFWNLRQPVQGDDLRSVLTKFIKIILYQPLYLTLTTNAFLLFKSEYGLSIPFQSMTIAERNLIKKIYVNRYIIFEDVDRFQQNNTWRISKYRGDHSVLWPDNYRKEMIREFVQFLFYRKSKLKSVIRWELIVITQTLISERQQRDVRFLQSLHDKLQDIGNINNWMVSEI